MLPRRIPLDSYNSMLGWMVRPSIGNSTPQPFYRHLLVNLEKLGLASRGSGASFLTRTYSIANFRKSVHIFLSISRSWLVDSIYQLSDGGGYVS